MNDLVLYDDVRLVLTQPHHAEKLFDLLQEEQGWLAPWMEVPVSLSAVVARVDGLVALHSSRRAVACGIWNGDELVGECNAFDIAEDHGLVEFGYWLAQDAVGNGLATRAVNALVGYAFESFEVQRAEIWTATENTSGRAVAERAGFSLEGIRRQCEHVNGRVVDHAMYGLLRSEWPEPAASPT